VATFNRTRATSPGQDTRRPPPPNSRAVSLKADNGQPPTHPITLVTYVTYLVHRQRAQAVRVGEDVDLDDPVAPDGEGHDRHRPPVRGGDQAGYGAVPVADDDYVERRVEARLKRQALLTKTDPLKLWAIVDEAVLHRLVGGAEVMAEQLRRLVDATKEPHITLQVLPYSLGAHPGMPGSFAMMEFPDPADPELVYLDSMAGDLFLEREADVRRFTVIFEHLRAAALNPKDSVRLVGEVAAKIK
jgi:hypothetical protein